MMVHTDTRGHNYHYEAHKIRKVKITRHYLTIWFCQYLFHSGYHDIKYCRHVHTLFDLKLQVKWHRPIIDRPWSNTNNKYNGEDNHIFLPSVMSVLLGARVDQRNLTYAGTFCKDKVFV